MAGFSRMNFFGVLAVVFFANILWTPALVYLAYLWGTAVYVWMDEKADMWWVILVGILCFYVFFSLLMKLSTRSGRKTVLVFCRKFFHPEFWPPWIFYFPLAPYILYLMVRYRSATCFTAANPSIPAGGLVGESKADILKMIPKKWVADFFIVDPSQRKRSIKETLKNAHEEILRKQWKFPVIGKPDISQRGAGFRILRTWRQCEMYIREAIRGQEKIIIQKYHPGPCEIGVFYLRNPKKANGMIFSITDKNFPFVIGDGKETLGELIDQHSRFQLQRSVFRKRWEQKIDWIPKHGEPVQLAYAGNHCQGTKFLDGAHFISPQLRQRINEISKKIPDFYFGRYDIRFSDIPKLKQGRDFVIIELNGVTSESTNLYDPKFRIWEAYRILFRQWDWLFRIGKTNIQRGFPKTTLRAIARLLIQYYIFPTNKNRQLLSD